MDSERTLKLFGMSNLMLEHSLKDIEKRFNIKIKNRKEIASEKDNIYFPQFDQDIRNEASEMAQHYEAFYCLEKSIRELIIGRLKEKFGAKWWEKSVAEKIRGDVTQNIKNELDAGVTLRSTEEIDYTTFGQLSDIIIANWDIFGDQFNSRKGLQKVMSNLNVLRSPIAHCSPLAPREVIRLQITIEDWFGLME